MLVRDIILALLLFGGAITGFYVFLIEGGTFYNVDVGSNYASTYNRINSTIGSTETLSEEIQKKIDAEESVGTGEILLVLSRVSIEAIKMPFKALAFIFIIFTDLTNVIGIPNWATYLIIGIILTVVTFAVLSAIRGTNV